ncbi:MAG: hypothetical protein ACI37S_03595 [Candidatus Gastranaerophilaceae bacterium]
MKYLIKLNTARNCIRYLIRAYDIKVLYVPYYICPAVKRLLKKEFIKVQYYHIDDRFMPVQNFRWDDFILYPNYFGICTNNVKQLAKKYRNLIVDNSHAFYAEPMGLASFNSLRKFFQMNYSVMDGAYLYTDKKLDQNFKIAEDYEINYDIDYEAIVKNENRLNNDQIFLMSKTTEKLMSTINFEYEKLNRLNNYRQLEQIYGKTNELNISLEQGEVPFVYPYFTRNEKIGYELEKQGLLIFRYWEGLPSTFEEYNFYKYLIPIPLY